MSDEFMQALRKVEAQFGVEAQCRMRGDGYGAGGEDIRDRGWRVNRPLFRLSRAFDRPSPLNQPCFLADVNFLPRSDQADHDAPPGDATGELYEVLGFRLIPTV